MYQIETITQESFAKFGRVIEFTKEDQGNFTIIADDKEKPWRLAVFRYENHAIKQIECHPTSMESFEPLEGVTILLTAEPDSPEQIHLFLLDRPIVLEKGVWHQTLALTPSASVKITENIDVYSVYRDLEKEITVAGI